MIEHRLPQALASDFLACHSLFLLGLEALFIAHKFPFSWKEEAISIFILSFLNFQLSLLSISRFMLLVQGFLNMLAVVQN